MNLLFDSWLYVRTHRGTRKRIAPWQLTETPGSDLVSALDFPRPDFDTAVLQFLIALLQTTFPPESDTVWERYYDNAPDPETLRSAFEPYRACFELDGDGPRFMQDFDLPDAESKPVGGLLVEEPGGNTLRENKDHFLKRGRVDGLSYSMAAAALFTLQTNAPSGGVGHRVSIRGGGPLTTLVVPDPAPDEPAATLWQLVWFNVLPRSTFLRQSGDEGNTAQEAIFPWMGPTRTSEPKTGAETTPLDAHPLQMYWAMPRRIQLDFDDTSSGDCALTGDQGPLVRRYRTRNYGVNYGGAWRHPLSPYRFEKDGSPIALHPSISGLGYRHWLALVYGERDGSAPASVVRQAIESYPRRRRRSRLWAFGYDMDNMKARGWHESLMPILHADAAYEEVFRDKVQDMLECAAQVAGNLRQALRRAWFGDGATVRGDLSFIEQAFWENTEPAFYEVLERLHRRLEADPDDECDDVLRNWHGAVDDQSLALFDLWAISGDWEDEDPRRIVMARHGLRRFNRGKRIRERMQLNTTEPV